MIKELGDIDKITFNDFYKSYKGNVNRKLFKNILYVFFKKLALLILQGESIYMPYGLGYFRMRKIYRTHALQVDFFKTNQNKKEGIDRVEYRTDEYYYEFSWFKKLHKYEKTSTNDFFKFEATYHIARTIPQYHNILDIKTL
jgi:hypothetical protein